MHDEWPELLPPRLHRRGDVGETMVRVGLGLTLYLDEPGYWAFGGAARWVRRALTLLPREELRFYRTSTRRGWRRIPVEEQEVLLGELDATRGMRGIRHLLEVTLSDDPGAPRLGFRYREVHPERSPRCGVLQLFFGNDLPSDALRALALELASEAPIRSGVGGWLARTHPQLELGSFDALLPVCRRYLGVDIQRPDGHAHRDGLSSVGWLTLLGPDLAARVDPPTDPRVSVTTSGATQLWQAGPQPELGDMNAMQYPEALHAATLALAPLLADLEPFPGAFAESDLTARWQRRFLQPDGWA